MTQPKKYRPSNGTEGEIFIDKFCMNCIHCDPDPRGKKQCDILCATMCFDVTEPEYPGEWIYDDKGQPTCTAHVKWDWDSDGDPDDRDNPKRPQPYAPNQLRMFVLDGIIDVASKFIDKHEDAIVESLA